MTVASTDTLVKKLDSAGQLPAGFGPLLQSVDRKWFIPDQIWVEREAINRASHPDKWLNAVYSNSTIVTQFDDGHTRWPGVGDIPTCSASMPSAVVGMLDQLEIRSGHSILEIGTGTGFNAALLSEMVPMGVEFMEIRAQRTARTPIDDFDWTDDTADQRTTKVKPWLMFSDIVSRWALAVALPSCRYDMAENQFAWLRDPISGSWASVTPDSDGHFLVRQKGIRRLWDQAESAYRWWISQGKPVGPDWEWTITPTGQTIELGPR